MFYLCIFQKRIPKNRKTICGRIYFVKVVGLQTTAYFKWNPKRCFARFFEGSIACSIKRSKKLSQPCEGKSAFQTIAIELYKQPGKKLKLKKENLRIVITSFVVANTDDEIYVLSITKIYNYISFVSSTVPKKVELLKSSIVFKGTRTKYFFRFVLEGQKEQKGVEREQKEWKNLSFNRNSFLKE